MSEVIKLSDSASVYFNGTHVVVVIHQSTEKPLAYLYLDAKATHTLESFLKRIGGATHGAI